MFRKKKELNYCNMKYNLGYNMSLGIIGRALPGGGFCAGCL